MLYLVRTHGRGSKTSLKIGFTDNLPQRMSSYREQNPFFELLSTREGDEKLELYLHLYLEALGFKENFLYEWFKDCYPVMTEFHAPLNKIQRVVWRERNKVFSEKDIKQKGLRLTLYEDLRFLHREDPDFKLSQEIKRKTSLF